MENWKKALKVIKKQLTTPDSDSLQKQPARELGSTKVTYGTVSRPQRHGSGRNTKRAKEQRAGQPVKTPPVPPGPAPAVQPRPVPVQRTDTPRSAPAAVSPPKPLPVPDIITPRRPGALSRQSWFRLPADWVENGKRLQLTAFGKSQRSIDIVIGLDFGTSYTKAAVSMLDKIYPVSWEGTAALPDPCLLPTEFTLHWDGSVMLGQHPDAGADQIRHDLKLPFLTPGVSTASVSSASTFVGLVLRYVRAWVFEKHASKIGSAAIRWHLNLGVPSNGLEDGRLESAYRRLGCIGWLLSESAGPISLSGAEAIAIAWAAGGRPESLHDLNVAPEFVAQIAGYVQSPQRIEGLHALVDVGGGTMDIATFIVHHVEGDDTFPFLVPVVKSLGTQMLIQNRLVGAETGNIIRFPDYLSPVAQPAEFAGQTGISENHIVQRDAMFSDAIQKTVHGVFLKTRSRRYRLSDAWSVGLRTFVTGGGSAACGYVDAVRDGGKRVARSVNVLHLPLHPRLADFHGSQADYQRLSVACGLAQDAFSLGRIIPAKEVEDDIAVTIPVTERFSHEDLYGR